MPGGPRTWTTSLRSMNSSWARAVGRELGKSRPAVRQDVVEHLEGLRIDEVHHVGGLGGIDQHPPVGAHTHALGFDADGDLREDPVAVDVDDGHQVIVFIGDVERVPGWMKDKQLRVGSGREVSHDPLALPVNDLDRVVVAGADQKITPILGQRDPPWSLSDLEIIDNRKAFAVDDADGVVLLVRDIDLEAGGMAGHREGERRDQATDDDGGDGSAP